MKNIFYILLLLTFFSSCKKDAGVGGTGTVKGKILVNEYSGTTPTGVTFDGADVDVYIVYGGTNSFYDDKITTSYDGSFEFRYLRKGDYKVFVYSKDVLNAVDGDLIAIFQSATLAKNDEVYDVGTIEIND